jgi:hypothetical protein
MTVSRLRFAVALTLLLACSLSDAQEVKELARHPGDVLKFEVKFDGPDASKVKHISLYLALQGGSPPSNQPGFTNGFRGASASSSEPNIFRPEIRISENAATGDYFLMVSAAAEPGDAEYKTGEQFQMHLFHIENPKSFNAPKITVKEQP